MVSDVFGDVRKRVLQTFPERQIYLRSGGEVTYFNLSTRIQLFVVALLTTILLWCMLSLLNVTLGVNPFSDADSEVQKLEARYERLLADSQAKEKSAKLMLAEQRESFERMAAVIEAKHNTLTRIVGAEAISLSGQEPAIKFAEAEILMAPTIRDATDRVARRNEIAEYDIATGLPIDRPLTALADTQSDILISAEAEILDRIDFNRALIQATEMDVDTILQQGTQGQGGPYIPLDGIDVPDIDGQFQSRITTIQARLYESEALTEAITAMPLGHPVKNETVLTSKFGVRRDPFTRRPTFHAGLDFISGPMAPIVATAPGTITHVGRKGAYGLVVEIDHGHGFKTRYAHLKKTFVKRGQTVEKGERVGGMGSTGRSTATHLHYEVHFQGRAYDPKKFLKAGLYVH